jgi:hypothetical protein
VMELRMQLDDEFVATLTRKLNLRATDLIKEGLTILNWAVHELENDRVILSAERNGENVTRLAMAVLEKVVGSK